MKRPVDPLVSMDRKQADKASQLKAWVISYGKAKISPSTKLRIEKNAELGSHSLR